MSSVLIGFAAAGFLLTTLCVRGQGGAGAPASGGVQSQYTSLKFGSCKETPIPDDADGLTYLLCPGVAGYSLQIRQVESGRLSINVVSPAKHVSPLKYEQVVTRSMDDVDDKAEWRVPQQNGKVAPIALIVRVMAHESRSNPAKVTNTYWAVAKIADGRACVTDSIRDGSKSLTEVQALADSAANRPCATRLPMLTPPVSH